MAATKSIPEKPDTAANVLKAIKGLRKGHEVGSILLKQGKLQSQSEVTGIAALAAKHGFYPEAGRKLRKFAALYSQADVDGLCDLCREKSSAFGISDVFLLLPIRNRSKRLVFQRKAIANRWGHTRLRHELRRQFGREPAKRGRKPQRPRDATDAVLQLFEMSFRFTRWHDYNVSAQEVRSKKAVQLPRFVREALNEAIETMKKLHAATDRALKKVR